MFGGLLRAQICALVPVSPWTVTSHIRRALDQSL